MVSAIPTAIVVMDIAGVSLAVDAGHVTRVLDAPETTPLPRGPAHVPALALVGARALPLLALRTYLQLEREDEPHARHRVVVVETEPFQVGLLAPKVSFVDETAGLPAEPPTVFREGKLRPYALAALTIDDHPVLLLDLPRLLEDARIRA